MRFGHGELHLVVLALLESRAMHGYELMAELTDRTARRYRASPGSIYPAVNALEGEGLISSHMEGERRVYALTRSGKDALAKRKEQLAEIEATHRVRFTTPDVDAALARFAARVRTAGGRVDVERVEPILDRAATEIESLSKGVGDGSV